MTTRDTQNLMRAVDFRATDTSDDGLTLEGYAAVFNDWTPITDRVGTFNEAIAPGAFKRSLDHSKPVLQFDHGQHPLVGSLPLGKITSLREDARGLFIRARLSDNWLIQPVRDAIRDEGVTGMSFRFSVVDEQWETRDGEEYRTITEVKLYEVGPVVFPAYPSTEVGVRARETAVALSADPDFRSEVASLIALGTDDLSRMVESSPADTSGSPSGTQTPVDAPAVSHASRTKTQRQAIARLALRPRKD